MAFQMFQDSYGSDQDWGAGLDAFTGSSDFSRKIGSQSLRNAQTTGQMMGANLQGLGEIMQAKDTANAWREIAARQEQSKKRKGLWSGIADVVSTGLGFIPGIGTAAKIGIGLATQAGKSFL